MKRNFSYFSKSCTFQTPRGSFKTFLLPFCLWPSFHCSYVITSLGRCCRCRYVSASRQMQEISGSDPPSAEGAGSLLAAFSIGGWKKWQEKIDPKWWRVTASEYQSGWSYGTTNLAPSDEQTRLGSIKQDGLTLNMGGWVWDGWNCSKDNQTIAQVGG